MQKTFFHPKQSIMGINVTPIIDVALVLVIILIITTPIMTISDLAVNLPRAHVRSAEQGDRLNITLNTAGEVAVDKVIVSREDLVGTLGNRLRETDQSDVMVVVRADGAVPHSAVREVLRDARAAGARRLAIATTRSAGREDQELEWMP